MLGQWHFKDHLNSVNAAQVGGLSPLTETANSLTALGYLAKTDTLKIFFTALYTALVILNCNIFGMNGKMNSGPT